MAKQNSYLKIKGRLGDLSFYKMQGEHLVREKSSVDAKRIANDPAYARTRENNAEFARAATAGKLLRTALRNILLRVADNRVTSRMSKEMLRVVKADKVSTRGARNVIDGEAELLEGFNFNSHCPLSTVLYASYTAVIDRVAGILQIDVPPFIPGLTSHQMAYLVCLPSYLFILWFAAYGSKIRTKSKAVTAEVFTSL